jgi:hypothetical protein
MYIRLIAFLFKNIVRGKMNKFAGILYLIISGSGFRATHLRMSDQNTDLVQNRPDKPTHGVRLRPKGSIIPLSQFLYLQVVSNGETEQQSEGSLRKLS